MWKMILFLFGLALVLFPLGCTKHKVEVDPVEIKPIHITIDVNVKVDKALEDFFGDIDEAEIKLEKGSEETDALPAEEK